MLHLMQQTCQNCQNTFEITDADLVFYDSVSPIFAGQKYQIPAPTFCPTCRLQRRLAFINQITVYTRTSSISGKRIFSMFPENVPFPVYENDYWWSDAWSAVDYGRDYDAARPFFEQYQELQNTVPHFALMVLKNEDCDYCNNVSENKHCYLCFNTRRSENCTSCERVVGSVGCMDCYDVGTSERCYNCVACNHCYNLQESQECADCTDSFFLLNCRSCTSCFGCVNLRHAQYQIFNVQHTKEQYDAFMQGMNMASFQTREEWRQKAMEFWLAQPRPHAVMNMVEHVSGNYLFECKNVHDSYFIRNGEDLRYCALAVDGVKNSYDFTTYGDQVELVYESARCGNRFVRSAFCYYSYDGCSDLFYSSYCVGCTDCFGCVGLCKKQYCILNKQYTKEEYGVLVPQIIAQMQSAGEWGEFFPIQSSPTPYNHTFAQRYFPFTKEQIEGGGLRWTPDEAPDIATAIEASALPDIATPVTAAIVVKSVQSGKAFSITPLEVKQYVALNAPLPRTTYIERMRERAKKLGGMTLYERQCAKTGKPILTVIPPDAPWVVWDKDVYEAEFSS